MSFHHYLNVYGPDDLLLYSSDPLPMDRVKLAKDIAQVGPADPEALGSYLLTDDQAQKIAGGSLKPAPGYSVLLEPIADDDTPSHGASQSTTNDAAGRSSRALVGNRATTGKPQENKPRRRFAS